MGDNPWLLLECFTQPEALCVKGLRGLRVQAKRPRVGSTGR